MPACDQVTRLAENPELGSRGESALHWFALHGRADLVLAWIKAGGPIAPDEDGRGPWHWAASVTLSHGSIVSLLEVPKVVEELRLSASWIDNHGRDVLGTICLMERGDNFVNFARAYPEVAALGLNMGHKGQVSCIDAWIGSVGVSSSQLNFLVTSLGDVLGVPSEELPVPMHGGLWTPELWRLALRARLPDELWTRREAQAIGCVLSEASNTKKSARI